jgi:hypothetical protein
MRCRYMAASLLGFVAFCAFPLSPTSQRQDRTSDQKSRTLHLPNSYPDP